MVTEENAVINRTKQKNGICFLAVAVLIGAAFWLLMLWQREAGGIVVVSVSGKEVERLSLNQDLTKEITGKGGGTNLLVIRDGKTWIEDASCPDHLCVKKQAVSRTGESIICLPNQVVVTIKEGTEEEGGVDAIAR